MNRPRGVVGASLFVGLCCAIGGARAELVRRAACVAGDAAREIEIRSIDGVAGVCEIVERVVGASVEVRTPYSAAPRSGLCGGRFEASVRSLVDAGWRCTVEPRTRPRPDAAPSAETWRIACVAAQRAKNVARAETLCDCAVGRLNEAGMDERAFRALLSPGDAIDAARSARRPGRPDDVGMAAVDAIARCDTP